jgi:hypothetical protein
MNSQLFLSSGKTAKVAVSISLEMADLQTSSHFAY